MELKEETKEDVNIQVGSDNYEKMSSTDQNPPKGCGMCCIFFSVLMAGIILGVGVLVDIVLKTMPLVTLILLAVLSCGFFIYGCLRLKFVAKDEQLFIELITEQHVINGPQVAWMPLFIRSWAKKKAITMTKMDYCVVKNSISGDFRVEKGPQLLFLRPYDDAEELKTVISLKKNEFVRFLDRSTGKIRVEKGEKGCVIPSATEVILNGEGKKQAIDLKAFEYCKIEDKQSGKIRTVRGEKLVFLEAFEKVVGAKKRTAVEVDDETSVLVRNKRSGQQSLVSKKQLYFPDDDEEILEVRKLIKLADYEACIVRGKDGQDTFYFGTGERSFFLPPHSELVKLVWSRGRRRQKRDLIITKLDLRPMYMSFEFNVRTADNVELVLEGSFFWEVRDLRAMVKFTNDTTGDICNHARSQFIERVSKVTLQAFMVDFNKIAEQCHSEDQQFYTQRGVVIHSLEVTGYHCADRETAAVLGQIIKETTHRMNRLQQQESETEVQLYKIKGEIEEEKARGELLKVQTSNSNAKSAMDGLAESEKVRTFLTGLKSEIPDLKERVNVWSVLRKRDALREVAQGNTKLYFTPADANLSIESHEHEHK